MSLLALCVAWSMRLCRSTSAARWAIPACVLIAIGLACDLCGETIMIFRRHTRRLQPGGVCHNDALLSTSRSRRGQRRVLPGRIAAQHHLLAERLARGWPGVMGFVMWIVGLGLTAAVRGVPRGNDCDRCRRDGIVHSMGRRDGVAVATRVVATYLPPAYFHPAASSPSSRKVRHLADPPDLTNSPNGVAIGV